MARIFRHFYANPPPPPLPLPHPLSSRPAATRFIVSFLHHVNPTRPPLPVQAKKQIQTRSSFVSTCLLRTPTAEPRIAGKNLEPPLSFLRHTISRSSSIFLKKTNTQTTPDRTVDLRNRPNQPFSPFFVFLVVVVEEQTTTTTTLLHRSSHFCLCSFFLRGIH